MNVQKILMPTDFSECSNAALNHALLLAEYLEAELDLLHVTVLHNTDPLDPSTLFPDADEISQRLCDVAAGEMKALIAPHLDGHLDIHEVQRHAVAAAPAIVDYATEEDVGLIVIGAHGRRGFRRFMLGSVTEEVVRLAPCPVLTVRGAGAPPELGKLEKIVVPFDFSWHAKTALAKAVDIAAELGEKARLYVVHVIEPIMEPHPYVPVHYRPEYFDPAQLAERVHEDLLPIVGQIADRGVDYQVEVLEGTPALSLAEYAETLGADLVVISTHGRAGLSHFFLGSVAEKLVRSCPCPILTLKRPVEEGEA